MPSYSKYAVSTPNREEFYKQVRKQRRKKTIKRSYDSFLIYIIRIQFLILGYVLAITLPFIKDKEIIWQLGFMIVVYLIGNFIFIREGFNKRDRKDRVMGIISLFMIIIGVVGFYIDAPWWIKIPLVGLGSGFLLGSASERGGEVDWEEVEEEDDLTDPSNRYLPYNIFH